MPRAPQTIIETDWSWHAGMMEFSAPRSARLYQIWFESIGVRFADLA